jgi:hypothetical protein
LTHAADAEKAPIGGAAMALVRLLIALAVAATAYVLIAPRVPALRGWYAANACPYLDRIRTGLCAQTLAGRDMPRRGESARDTGPAEGAAERPNSIASELAQLRQAQQEQGKSLASLAEAQRRNDEREAEEQQRLAAMRQDIQEMQQALAGLKQEIGELRAARPPTPARPAPRAAAPPR